MVPTPVTFITKEGQRVPETLDLSEDGKHAVELMRSLGVELEVHRWLLSGGYRVFVAHGTLGVFYQASCDTLEAVVTAIEAIDAQKFMDWRDERRRQILESLNALDEGTIDPAPGSSGEPGAVLEMKDADGNVDVTECGGTDE